MAKTVICDVCGTRTAASALYQHQRGRFCTAAANERDAVSRGLRMIEESRRTRRLLEVLGVRTEQVWDTARAGGIQRRGCLESHSWAPAAAADLVNSLNPNALGCVRDILSRLKPAETKAGVALRKVWPCFEQGVASRGMPSPNALLGANREAP